MFIKYFNLIKPRIVIGNLISCLGSFLLASKGNINYLLLFNTLIGMFAVLSSSCMLNNLIDCDIDCKMQRTKNRIYILNSITFYLVFFIALFFGFLGFIFLYKFCNMFISILSLIGFLIYVILYSLIMKRYFIHSILIGSLSGSIPPIIGYCSVTNNFDYCAFILFIMYIFWQIPHSYSSMIYNICDYRKIDIKILPIVKGILLTKKYIIFYIIIFSLSSLFLYFFNYVNYKYLIVISCADFFWFFISCIGFIYLNNDRIWSRCVYLYSLLIVVLINFMISIDYVIY
ncbi:heme o synthase [Candidatus Purcelliella pentastirinorum]|uniref:Protoheme IX farnesyltransferase n=1 Tax=Candidatus Purcelliella pentastirinorum TaxID=472834 RepID=A0AAX3N9X7_9ENTR|nr:heme o synthase [Candidatus Purcelliella pentastirinorum]WDI78336.1 heme o synthase [Candidatus Purcelliella pentastirinorum]